VKQLAAGYEPNAAVADLEGRFLYVANRIGNDISVIDLARGVETKHLLAGRGAAYLRSPRMGGACIARTSTAAGGVPDTARIEVTVIDTRRQEVVEREKLHDAAGVFHVVSADGGRVAIAAEMRPKNLIPLAHVDTGG